MTPNTLLIPRPGPKFGPYPERLLQHEPWPFYPAELIRSFLLAEKTPSKDMQTNFLKAVHTKRSQLAGCSAQLISAGARALCGRLALEGFTSERVADAFALIDACMQKELNIRLHDTQFLAGWLMLDRRLIEMQTGEGKTLAVALAAATGALAGMPVHVITANDYLVERDATYLEPVLQALGLSVGFVTTPMPPAQRREAYRCDITYCTAKELAFDYLRDYLEGKLDLVVSSLPSTRYLRGLCMAIIDEADSILLDDARMPLILANPAPNRQESAFYRQALFLAAQLTRGEDFLFDSQSRFASLTPDGEQRAARLASRMGGLWNARLRREEMLCLALAAQHLFVRDRDYLVRDKRVVIIDESTGRLAPGRTWSRGLHQLIELKEGCPPTAPQETSAQTTFQRFFGRYLRLSGVSGTLTEARGELLAIYGLPVARVQLRLPCRRLMLPTRLFPNREARWSYVVRRISEFCSQGRPVLIGTDSVADSELLAACLVEAGIAHTVLNANFDANEAEIILRAGQSGAVTIATNMAGRGTDIALGEGVAERGGLHVIACQNNHSARIDRQLYGRCARQGDPGSVEHLHCMEHSSRSPVALGKIPKWFQSRAGNDGELPVWLARSVSMSIWIQERRGRQERWFSYLNDRQMGRRLAFAGGHE